MSSSAFKSGKPFFARINEIELTPAKVTLVWLRLIDEFQHSHRPGQYLSLKIVDEWSFFSIASVHAAGQTLELHIQTQDEVKINFLTEAFSRQALVEVKYPFGQVHWPIELPQGVLLTRGTGFAPAKALITCALSRNPERSIHLLWEGARWQDFYFQDWILENLHKHGNFKVSLCLTDLPENSPFQNTHERLKVTHGVMNDELKVIEYEQAHTWYYLCASPQRVYEWVDALLGLGVDQAHMGSDVFEYAPR